MSNITTPYYQDENVALHHGDALKAARRLDDASVDCIVTSPPYYGLRDYGDDGQYGLEETPAAYVETMRALFSELRRVLSDDGTLWLNIGDSYASGAGGKPGKKSGGLTGGRRTIDEQSKSRGVGDRPHKNLLGIPWRVAFALQDDGWILRNAIVWHKPNAMPESVADRLSVRYEQVFMLAKSPRYAFDLNAIREKSAAGADKNPGDVWSINTSPFPGAHFAVFPQELARRCILAGSKHGDTVLDPFSGSGTTGQVAQENGRKYVGIDISETYLKMSLETRLQNATLDFGGAA